MTRPALPQLKRGDTLIMRSGVPGRRDGQRDSEVRVVIVGRKFVHVITADRFDKYDPEAHRWLLRKFLIDDQREGERGRRIGYSASIATPEQHAYDRAEQDAAEYLADQGLDVRPGSPWRGREGVLAEILRAAEADV